jgi:hypothetical protein
MEMVRQKVIFPVCWDILLSVYFLVYVQYVFCTLSALQMPAPGTVTSQVAIHLGMDRVCLGLWRKPDSSQGLLLYGQKHNHRATSSSQAIFFFLGIIL